MNDTQTISKQNSPRKEIKFNETLQIRNTYSSEEYDRTNKVSDDQLYNKMLIKITTLKDKLIMVRLKTHKPGDKFKDQEFIKKLQELEELLQNKILC